MLACVRCVWDVCGVCSLLACVQCVWCVGMFAVCVRCVCTCDINRRAFPMNSQNLQTVHVQFS